jgi:hypothetical protein
LGPRVLFTRSPTAMAPTNEDLKLMPSEKKKYYQTSIFASFFRSFLAEYLHWR